MKKLLSAIAIAASTTAFAEYVFNYDVVTTNDFEAAALGEGTGGFAVEVSAVEGATHDATTVAAYASDDDKPQQTAPAASEYGSQYLALQTNDDTVWTNLTGAADTVYVDTFLKFNECGDDAEDLDEGAKTALWMSGDSLYIKGLASDGSTNNYALAAPGSDSVYYPANWYRLTVSTKVFDGALHFNVRVNGEEVSGTPAGIVGGTATNYFRSLLGNDTHVASVGFKGTGSLDNFGAATRYPMPNSYEHYFASGTGTVDDPFIATADELKAYSDYGLTLDGKFFSIGGYIAEGTALAYDAGAYTIADGAAALNSVWYATFAEAYDHASAQSDTLEVKIAGDFTPVFSDPSANNNRTFASIKFTTSNTAAENISILPYDSKSVMKTANWVFPENATLTPGSSVPALMSVTGGTLNVSSSLVVTMGASNVLDNVAALAGDGTIAAPAGVTSFDAFLANNHVKALLQASTWCGTLKLTIEPVASGAFNPNVYGNGNSTVMLANDLYSGTYFGTGSAEPLVIAPTINLATNVTVKNGYTRTDDSVLVTFTKLTGVGDFTTWQPGGSVVGAVRYAITTLENYTGALVVSDKTEVRVGNVVLATAPGDNCVVPVTLGGANSTIDGALTYTVTGSEETGKLVYRAVDGGTDGLYVAKTVNVTVTGGANATQAWTIDGVDAGSSAPATLTEGQSYVVVFTANDGFSFPIGATTTFEGTVGTEDITIECVDAVADGGDENTPFENGDGTTFTIPASETNRLHGVVADFSASTNGMTYAQAYALGLLNESNGEVSDLPAVTIAVGPQEISGETVNIVTLQLAGSLATRGGYTVTCKVYKSASLPIPAATEAEAVTLDPTGATAWTQATGDAAAGFYQVKVTVSNTVTP